MGSHAGVSSNLFSHFSLVHNTYKLCYSANRELMCIRFYAMKQTRYNPRFFNTVCQNQQKFHWDDHQQPFRKFSNLNNRTEVNKKMRKSTAFQTRKHSLFKHMLKCMTLKLVVSWTLAKTTVRTSFLFRIRLKMLKYLPTLEFTHLKLGTWVNNLLNRGIKEWF